MKIINEKGKLFGIINIIDLIVLIVIAALLFAGTMFIKNGGFNPSGVSNDIFAGPQEKMIIKYYQEEVNDFVVDKLEIGSPVYDDTGKNLMGTLIGFETEPSVYYTEDAKGNAIKSSKEDCKAVILITEVEGMRTQMGATVNGTVYSVGHSLILRAGDAKLYPRVYDIQVAKAAK